MNLASETPRRCTISSDLWVNSRRPRSKATPTNLAIWHLPAYKCSRCNHGPSWTPYFFYGLPFNAQKTAVVGPSKKRPILQTLTKRCVMLFFSSPAPNLSLLVSGRRLLWLTEWFHMGVFLPQIASLITLASQKGMRACVRVHLHLHATLKQAGTCFAVLPSLETLSGAANRTSTSKLRFHAFMCIDVPL